MPNSLPERRATDSGLLQQLTGIRVHANEIETVMHDLSPFFLARERAIAQAAELIMINEDADRIEKELKRRNLELPVAYAIYTAGFEVPDGSIELGKYGEGIFESFPSTEAEGHLGTVNAVNLNRHGDIALILNGRAHPTEWVGERFAPMILAHPLRVIKELIRRQRFSQGINPPIILTYLAGVIEGYEMQPGQMGIIISDSEKTNVMHPGFGPSAILDPYLGSHFQPKYQSSSDIELAAMFADQAETRGLRTFPVSVCGAPGTPEFENSEEIAAWFLEFMRGMDYSIGEIAGIIYEKNGKKLITPLFDMGVTFELATIRQRLKDEIPFSVLGLALVTDSVGETGSRVVDHEQNVQVAQMEAPKYAELILRMMKKAISYRHHLPQIRDFSISNLIYSSPNT